MANVIWLFGGSRLVRSVRVATGMTPQEFADALGDEVGWMVPTDLLLDWEDGRHEPPRQVERAIQRLANGAGSPVEPPPEVNRREFLSRAVLLGGLIVPEPSTPVPAMPERDGRPNAWDFEALSVPRISEAGISVFWEVIATYRLAYGSTSAEKLLPRVSGLIPVFLDIQKALRPKTLRRRGTSLLGQTAVIAGLLSLMGRHDLPAARNYYELAVMAAKEAADANLLAYANGSMSFHDVHAGRLRDGLHRILAAEAAATGEVSPITSAWLASMGSELHARAGDDSMSRRLLERAEDMIETPADSMESWRGVGTFDSSKVQAYRGSNLVLLRRWREAEEVLTKVVTALPPTRVKHRCTALGDLALALARQEEPDQAAQKGMEALQLATRLRHAESVMRVRRVYTALQPWKSRPAVAELGQRLVEAM